MSKAERNHSCGHVARKGGWTKQPCPACLPPEKAKKREENKKRFTPEPTVEEKQPVLDASPPTVKEPNWSATDIINLNGTEYVSTATADTMVNMLSDELEKQIKAIADAKEEKQRILDATLRVKRVAKIDTTSGSFLEITFDFKDTEIRPGQSVAFYFS